MELIWAADQLRNVVIKVALFVSVLVSLHHTWPCLWYAIGLVVHHRHCQRVEIKIANFGFVVYPFRSASPIAPQWIRWGRVALLPEIGHGESFTLALKAEEVEKFCL